MDYFLSESRRRALVRCLTELSMPADTAKICASFTTDLDRLDRNLASLVARLRERCSIIRHAALTGDEETRSTYDIFLKCDLAIFESYRDAIVAKGLAVRKFPYLNRTVAQVLEHIEADKALIMSAIGKQGMLQ